jgi:hypothetical protein
MTPTLVKRKQAEIEALYDTLEPHSVDRNVALARQSLVAAAHWLSKADQFALDAVGRT